MNSMNIGEEVFGHFNQLFAEIRLAVEAFPEDLWNREDESNALSIPCFLAHHTVWCLSLEHLLDIPGEKMPHNMYPDYGNGKRISKEQVLLILDDVEVYLSEVYLAMGNQEYLEKGEGKYEPLGAVMYALGHTRHHMGQLAQILKENGIAPPGWYPIG